MNNVVLTFKNLTRNRLRMVLTIAAIALPMLAFTVARSFVDGFERFLRSSDQKMRVCVHQKLTYVTPLPQRLRQDIEAMAPPGYIAAVCRAYWFGGKFEGNEQMTFGSLGMDRDTLHLCYPDLEMTSEDVERFQKERRGAVVSPSVAKKNNWQIGSRFTLVGTIPPFPKIEFVVVAIPRGFQGDGVYFAHDYYNEVVEGLTGEPIGVHNFWIRCTSEEARQWALTDIDRQFANSGFETRTEMESTFIASFAQSQGNWVEMVWTVGLLIVFVAVAVAFNTMSMAFRERTREFAVLKALGFPSGRIVRMVLFEGLLLGLIGGVVGVLPMYAWTQSADVRIPMVPVRVLISHPTMALGMGVAVACGVLAAIAPAVMAGRLAVAAALRKIV